MWCLKRQLVYTIVYYDLADSYFLKSERILYSIEKREIYMGLVEIASNNSVWRGMDYYENRKVISWESSGSGVYDGVVSGSEDNVYTVHIDTEHPRKSFCNCPFADGR